MKKLLLLIVGLNTFIAFGQAVFEPASSTVYDLLNRLSVRGIIVFNDELKPLTRVELFNKLLEAETHADKLTLLEKEEIKYLTVRYNKLTEAQLKILIKKLTHLHVSEMTPFYIMRYGFYEGHTSYRAEPLAIAIIFSLKSVNEIDALFNNDLYNILNQHFTCNGWPSN